MHRGRVQDLAQCEDSMRLGRLRSLVGAPEGHLGGLQLAAESLATGVLEDRIF